MGKDTAGNLICSLFSFPVWSRRLKCKALNGLPDEARDIWHASVSIHRQPKIGICQSICASNTLHCSPGGDLRLDKRNQAVSNGAVHIVQAYASFCAFVYHIPELVHGIWSSITTIGFLGFIVLDSLLLDVKGFFPNGSSMYSIIVETPYECGDGINGMDGK